jgi:hypothetical protein
VLLLNQGLDPANSFLTSAAQVCRAFQVTPVVLTVARSEKEARLRQRFAEETFAAQKLPGDFDFVVGCDVRVAVSLEARCRRCSHVFVEKHNAPPWWRWLRGDVMQRLLGLSESFAFLTLSGAGPPLRIGEPVALSERGAPGPDEAAVLTAAASAGSVGEGKRSYPVLRTGSSVTETH